MATGFDPSAILTEITARYLRLPVTQKVLFPLLAVGSIVLIVTVARWSSQSEYSVLFSDLSTVDSAAVVERLKEKKIKYQIRSDGRTIAITPPEAVHELRLEMTASGIPSGGKVGFEIFDVDSIGLTSFGERMKLVRALQGELERTIAKIDGVVQVRVHITQPEKSVFAKRGTESTASVFLKLDNKKGLEKSQIVGITNLVAGSVDGLAPQSVSIIDSAGNLLNPPEEEEDEGFGIEASRVQYQKTLERNYASRIEEMISRVIGPGKVIAKVSAELDFSSNERQEEVYDPATQVVRSERTVMEGTGIQQRGGVPGVVSNLTNDPNLLNPPGSSPQESGRQEILKNYEMSRAVTKTTSPRGTLMRLSAAVLVDGKYNVITADDGSITKNFVPLDDEVMTRIEGLVKGAIGYDVARGDSITVENIQFYEPDSSFEQIFTGFTIGDYVYLVGQLGTPLFIVLFVMFVVRPLVSYITRPTEDEVNLERLLPSGLDDLEKELKAERARADVPEIEPVVDLSQLEELIAENASAVKENPTQAALLIRYWLNEGRL